MRNVVVAIIVAAVLFMAFGRPFFIVDETQQVVLTQLGEPVGEPITEPGVHFKIPLIQEPHFFDKRFLEWNGDPNEVPTKDKRFLLVDTYARWRIVNPLLFFKRVRDERGAQSRLDDIIDGETRNAVAKHNVVEAVRSTDREVQVDPTLSLEEQTLSLEDIGEGRGRRQIMADIQAGSQARALDLGIEIKDVRFKRINYNPTVRKDVYQRMIAERQRIAERFVSEGEGESARIRGEKERRLKEIESGAYRTAQEIVGRADAESTPIYAEAYGADPGFYEFLKTMESYPATIDENTTLVMTSDGEFMRFLSGPGK